MKALVFLLVAALLAGWARRQAPRSRARALLPPRRARGRALPAALRPLVDARRGRGRRLALRRELPLAVELVRVAVASGLTPVRAVATVAPWAPPLTGVVLAGVSARCELGVRFADSLDEMARGEPELGGLARVLAGSADLGVAVEDALAGLGREARQAVRRDAEARAKTVPVRLLFPLVFLVLPAFGLLGVAPSVIAGFR